MRDYVSIGSTPAEEDCQQVGTSNYDPTKDRIERQVFIEQLLREFPNKPEGVEIRSKRFDHDYPYYEVCVFFDDNDEAAIDYAFNIESNASPKWDKESLKRLKELNAHAEH